MLVWIKKDETFNFYKFIRYYSCLTSILDNKKILYKIKITTYVIAASNMHYVDLLFSYLYLRLKLKLLTFWN